MGRAFKNDGIILLVAAGEQGFRLIFSTSEALESIGEHLAKLLLLACCYQEGLVPIVLALGQTEDPFQ